MASARVAPRASAASRRERGIEARTSREMDTMVGTTITASTIPAFSMPIPNGYPRNRGRKPRWAMSQGSTAARRKGASTNRPQRP